MDEDPPSGPTPDDRSASTDAWRLAAPPALFIVHFAAVYGWTGLACAFGWAGTQWGGLGLVPLGVIVLTALAMGVLWWAMPPTVPESRDVAHPYDPGERRHFLATASRMTGWLALAGMALVALPSLLARTCDAGL